MSEFVLLKDLVIPAGTKLARASNARGGAGNVEAVVAMGKDSIAWLNMSVRAVEDAPAELIYGGRIAATVPVPQIGFARTMR